MGLEHLDRLRGVGCSGPTSWTGVSDDTVRRSQAERLAALWSEAGPTRAAGRSCTLAATPSSSPYNQSYHSAGGVAGPFQVELEIKTRMWVSSAATRLHATLAQVTVCGDDSTRWLSQSYSSSSPCLLESRNDDSERLSQSAGPAGYIVLLAIYHAIKQVVWRPEQLTSYHIIYQVVCYIPCYIAYKSCNITYIQYTMLYTMLYSTFSKLHSGGLKA